MIRPVFFVPGEGPYIFFTFIHTEMRSHVRAGAQLVRVNSDKRHSLETATLEQKWRQTTQTRWVKTVTAIWPPPQYVKQLLVLKFRLGTYVTLLKP